MKNRVYVTFITLPSKSLNFNWIFLVRVFRFVATMPCCVVPGCTSGYGSNPDSFCILVHSFTIPKVLECEKIWKTEIWRTDNAMESGRAVYEKHFLENPIIRKREFFDTNGRVIGVVSTIKCIYLYWNCFELKRFHIIVIVGTSVQNTTFKASQCVINFSMVRGNMDDTRWTVVPRPSSARYCT